MYPAQTSLIPVQIALARFLETNGLITLFSNYPYWYLGTTPFRNLTGPIVPFLLVYLHKLFPYLSLLTIFYIILIITWLISGIGIYLFIKALGGEKQLRISGVFFYWFGLIVPFLFRFNDGLYLIAFTTLPFILFFYINFLKKRNMINSIFLIVTLTMAILINSLIIPTIIFGIISVILSYSKWDRIEKILQQSFFIFIFSLLIATIWYGYSYWLTLILGPSWAGKSLGSLVVWLLKTVPIILALFIGLFSVKIFKTKNLLRNFCFYWLAIFVVLTFLRFLSDPDFFMDWSAYGVEIQFGMAIAIGLLIDRWIDNNRIKIIILYPLYLLLYTFIFNKYVIATLQSDITKTVEYRIGSELVKVVKPDERVFLSGSTAFWFNAFFDISQVRGGIDQVSIDTNWRQVVWEVREGTNPQKAIDALRKIGVNYLVVHTLVSSEYYHDFVYPEKFSKIGLEIIYDDGKDIIYKID
ncbi:MAG: hypothetical protein V1858_00380 [Candidatus Gottesmanbacteria bacterium]